MTNDPRPAHFVLDGSICSRRLRHANSAARCGDGHSPRRDDSHAQPVPYPDSDGANYHHGGAREDDAMSEKSPQFIACPHCYNDNGSVSKIRVPTVEGATLGASQWVHCVYCGKRTRIVLALFGWEIAEKAKG